MLINLSNHPSASWSPDQRSGYNEIIDIPFPQVDPEGDGKYIDNLVNEYLDKVLAYKNVEAVHIMGEMCFCFKLIQKLKEHNIRCLASCTKRDTVEQDGVKVSKFKFVQFREY